MPISEDPPPPRVALRAARPEAGRLHLEFTDGTRAAIDLAIPSAALPHLTVAGSGLTWPGGQVLTPALYARAHGFPPPTSAWEAHLHEQLGNLRVACGLLRACGGLR
jgi:hypothetical protein